MVISIVITCAFGYLFAYPSWQPSVSIIAPDLGLLDTPPYDDPFRFPFRISNDSQFSLSNVTAYCQPDDIYSIWNENKDAIQAKIIGFNIGSSLQNIPKIESGTRDIGVTCNIYHPITHQIKELDIRIVVEFSYPTRPFRKSEISRRFFYAKNERGIYKWIPRAEGQDWPRVREPR